MIRAVVFDLDGTLYRKKTAIRRMIRLLFPHILRLRKYDHARKLLVGQDLGTARVLQDRLLDLVAGPKLAVRARWQCWLAARYYPALTASMASCTPREGLLELLDRLESRGIKLAVVSDYGLVPERLRGLGLPVERFAFLLGTEEAGMMKPAERVISLTASALGLAPDELLVIGDRADTDQAMAEGAGAAFIGVTDGNPAPPWLAWPEVIPEIERRLR